MDYTQIRKTGIDFAKARCSINPDCFEVNNTFYYDETDNVQKFRIREKGFNVSANSHFVLGGITTDSQITREELKNVWNFQNDPNLIEIKSTNKFVYKGEFVDVLKSKKLCAFFQLLVDKSCFIHFYNLNLLYYSLVDIIDSIYNPEMLPYYDDIKSMLYLVVQSDLSTSCSILHKYNYPNLLEKECPSFLKELILLTDNYLQIHPNYTIPLLFLKSHLQDGLHQNGLVLIQDNMDLEPIERLGDFYLHKVYLLPNAKHVFDNEEDVKTFFKKNPIELNGHKLENYSFVDSKNSVLIQVSDLVVALLRRYFKFCDRAKERVDSDIQSFTPQQLKTFKMLNSVLKTSLDNNPVFMHHCTNIIEYCNVVSLINEYGI